MNKTSQPIQFGLTARGLQWLAEGLGASDLAALSSCRTFAFCLAFEGLLLELAADGPREPLNLKKRLRSIIPEALREADDALGSLWALGFIATGGPRKAHLRFLRESEGLPNTPAKDRRAADVALRDEFGRVYHWVAGKRLANTITRAELLDFANAISGAGVVLGSKWVNSRLIEAGLESVTREAPYRYRKAAALPVIRGAVGDYLARR